MASYTEINDLLKWVHYSTYHPSWNSEQVLRDFQARKSLKQVHGERGMEWPLSTSK